MILHASDLMLSLGKSLLFILHTEHVCLPEGLVKLAANVLLGSDFLFVMILHASDLMLSVPEFAEERLSFLGFVVSNSPGFRQLVTKVVLQLGQHVGRVLHLLQLPQKVGILSGNLLLMSLDVVEVEVCLFNLLGLLVEGVEKALVGFLS